jgi:hypothetical protein
MNHFFFLIYLFISCKIMKSFPKTVIGLTFFIFFPTSSTGKCTMEYWKFGFSLSYHILFPGSVNAPWNIENLGFCYPITFYFQAVWFTQILFAVSDIFFTNIAFRDNCPLRALWNGSSLPVLGKLRGEISFRKQLRRSMDQYGTFFFLILYAFQEIQLGHFLGKMKHFPFLTHWW